ncbi:hypothetical protein [uncultured Roseobacter sp.]|uniref:hypothetical protein n=1 Tax=uncultured Roseobacter sp. TaxID=114847 RepID=UPI00261CF695|nr:hypothetical protein [uncultured Roseobacter sp.]
MFERLVDGSGGSLEEIFPEADMVCVVGQYRTSRRTLELYNVDVAFWDNTAVFENEVLIVLVGGLEVVSEQKRETVPNSNDGEAFSLLPENVCHHDMEARVQVTTRLTKPIYEVIDGEKRIGFPSIPYTDVKITKPRQ